MSLLDVIRIATPCSVAWSSMEGDDRSRHCGQCDKRVFDLSALSRHEAEALLAAKGANLCARYFERADGTIVLADCLVRRRRRRQVVAAAGIAAALGAGAVMARDALEPPVELAIPLPFDHSVRDHRIDIPPDVPDHVEVTPKTTKLPVEPAAAIRDLDWKLEGQYLGGAIVFDGDIAAGFEDDKMPASLFDDVTDD